MPSKVDSRPSGAPKDRAIDLDNYDIDDDPFRSPSPDAEKNKRKQPEGGLGIDEEVSVKKRSRAPNVKLDEKRLLSENGIAKLRRKAGDLKFKGKGHEFSDAARLLSFYQLWLDDLFPKAKFLDALAMVEKTGHKSVMHKMRMDWINEGKPKSSFAADDDDPPFATRATDQLQSSTAGPVRLAPVFEKAAFGRPKTPVGDDLFGDDDDDIYDATTRGRRKTDLAAAQPQGPGEGVPDEEDLDALMAEADTRLNLSSTVPGSIFGPARPSAPAPLRVDDDEDYLDALIAEAEAESALSKTTIQPPPPRPVEPDFTADEEAMAEMDGMW